MSEHFEGEDESVSITPSSKVPIYVIASSVALAIYGTLLYASIVNRLSTTMTVNQFQHWKDDAAEMNPTIRFPRIPAKDSAVGWWEPKDFTKPVKLTLK